MTKNLEFRCPLCGSREFGSREEEGVLIRVCHGFSFSPKTRVQLDRCNFSWYEIEDWMYMVIVHRFKNKSEFDDAMDEMRKENGLVAMEAVEKR